jgi:hypothetical protein
MIENRRPDPDSGNLHHSEGNYLRLRERGVGEQGLHALRVSGQDSADYRATRLADEDGNKAHGAATSAARAALRLERAIKKDKPICEALSS